MPVQEQLYLESEEKAEESKVDDAEIEEFPKHGVTLSFLLKEFIVRDCAVRDCADGEDEEDDEGKGRKNLQGLTTAQVCENIIKSKTFQNQSSYCDKLKQEDHPAYGEVASVFFSHAHQYQFLDVINALAWHMRDEPEEETIVWFDIFSINQHRPTQWTFDWLSTAFMSAIKSFGRTVVVLSPWHSPLPFKRLWCIYEAYSTLFTDGKFEIAMSERDQSQFLQDVRDDPERRIYQMLGTIRAEKAECYLDEDHDNIVSVIQRSVGF